MQAKYKELGFKLSLQIWQAALIVLSGIENCVMKEKKNLSKGFLKAS